MVMVGKCRQFISEFSFMEVDLADNVIIEKYMDDSIECRLVYLEIFYDQVSSMSCIETGVFS